MDRYSLYSPLLGELPEIRRARDCRLYDKHGNRYLDLWRNGGRALLGHRPDRVYGELKRVLQKGTVAEYPSVYISRLKKALKTLFPGQWEIRLFANPERALMVAKNLLSRSLTPPQMPRGNLFESLGTDMHPTPSRPPVETEIAQQKYVSTGFVEPFFLPEHISQTPPLYYRPFYTFDYGASPLVFPILPFPGSFAPQPLFIGPLYQSQLPPNDDPISPMLLATLTRTVWHLISALRKPNPTWDQWKLLGWKQFSCYAIPQFDQKHYPAVFRIFLEQKILIPPTPIDPLILPVEWSSGEKALVEEVAKRALQGGVDGSI
ncbi:MAG: hypothetical protein SNJ78_01905 [Spirochaetales bacterium]